MPRKRYAPPLNPELMAKLKTSGEHATPPKVPLPHNATNKQLVSAVLVLVAAFVGFSVLTGLALRIALFVAGR